MSHLPLIVPPINNRVQLHWHRQICSWIVSQEMGHRSIQKKTQGTIGRRRLRYDWVDSVLTLQKKHSTQSRMDWCQAYFSISQTPKRRIFLVNFWYQCLYHSHLYCLHLLYRHHFYHGADQESVCWLREIKNRTVNFLGYFVHYLCLRNHFFSQSPQRSLWYVCKKIVPHFWCYC